MSHTNTKEQQTASNPEYSVWVTANAGTGKTKILTDRFIQLVLSGTHPARILCLTFTKAAAAEMEKRIKDKFRQWALLPQRDLETEILQLTGKKPDESITKRARKSFTDLIDSSSNLNILTIHSFCQSLLKRFPLEAGVPPYFKVIEDYTAGELIKESWLRFLSGERIPDDNLDANARTALDYLTPRVSDNTLRKAVDELINNRIKFSDAIHGREKGFTSELYSWLGGDKNADEDEVLEAVCCDKNIGKDGLKILIQALLDDKKNRYAERAKTISDWITCSDAGRINNFSKYLNVFFTEKSTKKALKNILVGELAKKFPATVEAVLAEQQRLEMAVEQIRSIKTARFTGSIAHICEAILALYDYQKKIRAFLDYNDLISYSEKLLRKSDSANWVMYKLDDRIDHLLVDEAQDTSSKQWDIIEALCSEFYSGEGVRDINRTLFVVGDEKQSIFSFQGANPFVFKEKKESISGLFKDAGKEWREVPLNLSFRSTSQVLKAVDMTFSNDDVLKAISSSETEIIHQAFRSEHHGRMELWPLIEEEKSKEDGKWALPVARKKKSNTQVLLAEKIALQIRTWLDEGKYIPSKKRAIKECDVMILVRQRGTFVATMINALQKQGVNVAGVDRLKLTEHIAVLDLLALGNFILLPSDNLNLACLLKSPLCNVSEDQLFDLAYNRGEKNLWQILKEKQNFVSTSDYLSSLLGMADFMSPFDFYSYVLDVAGGRKLFISRLGNEVDDVLNEFLNITMSYESSHTHSMQGFLQWVTRGNSEVKRDLEHDKDEIRIMTVHASKGLQAPIIFLPDTTETPGYKGSITWVDDKKMFLWAGSVDNLSRIGAEERNRRKELEYNEYLRLLYVAMTRAEDELYICGFGKEKGEDSKPSWYDIVNKNMPAEAIKLDDGRIVIEADGKYSNSIKNEIEEQKITLPAFLMKPAQKEEESHIFESDEASPSPISQNDLYKKGKLIHKLLEILPDIKPELRIGIASEVLKKHGGTAVEIKEYIAEAMSIITNSEISDVFSSQSKAEVPLSGKVGNRVISRRIDRLVIKGNEVIIVDYKTNAICPESISETPASYLKQMAEYRDLIKKIYPNKQVKCVLLWTSQAKIFILDNPILDKYSFEQALT